MVAHNTNRRVACLRRASLRFVTPITCGRRAKVEKVRDGGRAAGKSIVIAHAVHESGRWEVVGLAVGGRQRGVLARVPAAASWRVVRQPPGAWAHRRAADDLPPPSRTEGRTAQVFDCPWQHCTVHLLKIASATRRGASVTSRFRAARAECAYGRV